MAETTWVPTRKWIVTQLTAVTALITAVISTGQFDKAIAIAAIGLVTQALASYLIPNADPAQRSTESSKESAPTPAAAPA